MSHFAVYEANVTNAKYLKKALEEMGLIWSEDVDITDFYGHKRRCDIGIVDKSIGFVWNEESEKYDVVADWWKTGYREQDFCNRISQLHEKYKVEDICAEQGFQVGEWSTLEDGSIQMVASRTIW